MLLVLVEWIALTQDSTGDVHRNQYSPEKPKDDNTEPQNGGGRSTGQEAPSLRGCELSLLYPFPTTEDQPLEKLDWKHIRSLLLQSK